MDSVLLSGSSPTFGYNHEVAGGGWMPPGRAAQDAERRRGPDTAAASGPAQERSSPQEDTSHTGHWLRYTSFVATLVVTTSAALFTVPVALVTRVGSCPRGCLSLPKDLSHSLNRSVHPCDDFYGHVCSGWDSRRIRYRSPMDRYRAEFSRSIIKSILLEYIPTRSTTARGKAAGFIFRCLSRTEVENATTFVAFLDELGLPWPSKSPTTRSQLLDILVRASLQLGMPMFWAFYVGRHPSRSSENTIYMTLDPRFSQWIRDIEALDADGKANDYLRRCAEIVGRTGQSYSVMIQQVLQTHSELVELVHRFWGLGATPQYYNLTDPDLRRAVNGYLPDDSQLWPVDEIVNLQPEFFARFDATHLSQDGYQERFKLFLGAYVVWVLSPIVSRYLTTSMLADMGHEDGADDYRFFKCLEALETLLPLVKWQLHRDAQNNLEPAWNTVRLSQRALSEWMGSYDGKMQKTGTSIFSRLGVNAFNMTNTWQMLDSAFAYLPNDTKPPFFELYRRYAKATATYFKQSLRRPQHSIYHVPGVVSILLYRVIVGREVSVPYFMISSPLFEPWYPATFLSALAGVFATTQMISLVRFSIFYNSRFQARGLKNVAAGARALGEDVYRLREVLNASGFLPDASAQEFRTVYEVALCNVALPASPRFRDAFKCGPQHRLSTTFMWPERSEQHTVKTS
ncbi:neprilysin-11-like isoform X2 [Dermacentor variabilis]|uniref:neprilysin-11-like isoform X2 n=1 Tax=Dermacentor variabilis TaxID=34621 RepID=UPI003F5C3B31